MQVVPRNDQAELAVLGACLIDPNAIFLTNGLSSQDFHSHHNRKVFKAIKQIADQGRVPDVIAVGNILGDGSILELMDLVAHTPTSAHVEHYAHEVQLCATRRRLAQAAANIMKIAHDTSVEFPVAEAHGALATLMDPGTESELIDSKEFWSQYLEWYTEPYDESEIMSTGFEGLDRLVKLRPESYHVIAGRPGMGKSALAQQMAESLVANGKRVLYVSAEMGIRALAHRIMARETGMTIDQIERKEGLDKATKVIGRKAEDLVHYIDSPDVTTSRIRSHLKRLQSTGTPADVLVVDYMQLCRDGIGKLNDFERTTLITQKLQAVKKEFKIAVIGVSQLNRNPEGRSNKRPTLSDFRGSGQIEQDVDTAMLLYREKYYEDQAEVSELFGPDDDPHPAEVIVAKNREGPTGKVTLIFAPKGASFYDVEPISRSR